MATGFLQEETGIPSSEELPPPPEGPVVLRIREGEIWCANCGEVIYRIKYQDSDDLTFSRCCRKPRPVPAASVLREGEYVIE